CSTRYARQVVKDLERDGWLERTLRPGQPTLYKVLTPEPQFTPSTSREEPQFTPELSSPLNPSSGVATPDPGTPVPPSQHEVGTPVPGGEEPQFRGGRNPSSSESPITTTTTTTAGVEGSTSEAPKREPLRLLPHRWNPDEPYIRMALETCPLVDLRSLLSRYILDRVEKGRACDSAEWYRWATADQQRAKERQAERDTRSTYSSLYGVAE